jgi:hypothetical protein
MVATNRWRVIVRDISVASCARPHFRIEQKPRNPRFLFPKGALSPLSTAVQNGAIATSGLISERNYCTPRWPSPIATCMEGQRMARNSNAPAAPQVPAEDDPALLAWSEWSRAYAEAEALYAAIDGDIDGNYEKCCAAEDRVVEAADVVLAACPSTLTGLVAKLAVALIDDECCEGSKNIICQIITDARLPLSPEVQRQIVAQMKGRFPQ